MKDILKEINIERFPVYLMISGFIFVLVSFIKTMPSPGNGWTVNLKDDPVDSLFLLGVVIVFVSVYLFWISKIETYNESTDETSRRLRVVPSHNTHIQADDSEDFDLVRVGSKEWGDALEKGYMSLSRTQQRLVTFVCDMPQSQMAIDDLFKGFVGRYERSFVENVSEMYFRLEALELKGYCQIKKIGPGASIVSVIPDVSKCLRERDLLVS